MSLERWKQTDREQKKLKSKKIISEKENQGEKKGRIALTILVTACVVFIMLLAAGIAFLIASHFLIYDMIPDSIGDVSKDNSALLFMLIVTIVVGSIRS